MSPHFIPGEWYLTVICNKCKVRIPVFRDLSGGQSQIVGGYSLACPECKHEGDYPRDSVEHYQHSKRKRSDL